MVDETPKKRACDKSFDVCRCCSVKINQRVYLFGQKARNDGILNAIEEFTKKEILEDDEFSKFVCCSCAAKLITIKKKMGKFRKLYIKSENLKKICRN